MSDFSFIANANPAFIDQMYEKYLKEPDTVEDGWKAFFSGFDFVLYEEVAWGHGWDFTTKITKEEKDLTTEDSESTEGWFRFCGLLF